jgi:formylglycine-generating enzyme required for sulfatase activity
MSQAAIMTSAAPAGDGFRDADFAPRMLVLPPGQFVQGATEGDDKFISDLELPRRRVRIPPGVALSKYPVTFDEWDAYVSDCPRAHRPDDRGWGRGRLPVFNVSWADVQGYLQWLTSRTGRAYRLPSESEWEYACRAGTSSVFQTGANITVDDANFLYLDYRQAPGRGRPVEVGSYPPNGFGLCDMHGNVCELVADDWHDNYVGAPTDGSAWLRPGRPSPWKVVRNGGWDALPRVLRCAFRDWVAIDHRYDNMGFRVACQAAGTWAQVA